MIVSYFAISMLFSLLPCMFMLYAAFEGFKKAYSLAKFKDTLGHKIASLKNEGSYRLIYIFPYYVLSVFVAIMASLSNKYSVINIIITIILFIIAIIAEIYIFTAKRYWGLYENGVFLKETSLLFSKIPEIKIINNNKIEILKPTGQRREINMNEDGVKYLNEKYNIEIGSTYVNNDWNIGVKE